MKRTVKWTAPGTHHKTTVKRPKNFPTAAFNRELTVTKDSNFKKVTIGRVFLSPVILVILFLFESVFDDFEDLQYFRIRRIFWGTFAAHIAQA